MVRNKSFKRVQFHFNGAGGCGVTTSYNAPANIQPTEKQLSFIGKSEIEYVLFYDTDTPQGNYGDKVGNK